MSEPYTGHEREYSKYKEMFEAQKKETMKKFSLLHRLVLKRHGMSDADVDAAEAAGLDWLSVLTMLLEVGLPILLEWLKHLKPKPPTA